MSRTLSLRRRPWPRTRRRNRRRPPDRGVFLAAEVSKQGGTNDITFVVLDIDGRNVTNISFAALANQGLTQHNPYGLAVFHSTALKTIAIGFPSPLFYRQSLRLSVTVNEPNVAQIVANVIHGA